VRRFATIALSFTLTLGLCAAGRLQAQDPKKDDTKTVEKKPVDTKTGETKPAEAKPAEAKPGETKIPAAAEPPLPPMPPAVEAKRQAALKAVAEYIVDAQDAGVVDTSISPPPILDLLITGKATDKRDLKAGKGVSPEVFGAWFSRQNIPMEGITAQGDVRIFQPSMGLQDLYDARAGQILNFMDTYRKAKAAAAPKPVTPPADTKKAEAKPTEPKPAETKPAAPQPDTKKTESKPADAPKTEAKPAETKPSTPPETKKVDSKPAETPKSDAKPAETKKPEETKKPGAA
jgi:hypothetical protein